MYIVLKYNEVETVIRICYISLKCNDHRTTCGFCGNIGPRSINYVIPYSKDGTDMLIVSCSECLDSILSIKTKECDICQYKDVSHGYASALLQSNIPVSVGLCYQRHLLERIAD